MMAMMMVMKIVTEMCFISGSARLVLKILSKYSNEKRKSGSSLSVTGVCPSLMIIKRNVNKVLRSDLF